MKECGGGRTQNKCNARIKKNHLQKSFFKKHPFLKKMLHMEAHTQIYYLPKVAF